MHGKKVRKIFIDNDTANAGRRFATNYIQTTKYTALSFLPLFLIDQFTKPANLFYVCVGILQSIEELAPNKKGTVLIPLFAIVCFSAVRELYEDYKRRVTDRVANNSQARRFSQGNLKDIAWCDLKVGQIVKIERNEQLPADMILLASSEPQGMAYLETSNIDGESNLKLRAAPSRLPKIENLSGLILCDQPNDQIYSFEGQLQLADGALLPLDGGCFLQRGSMLKNTKWAYAAIVYTGHDTKIFRNSNSTPLKRTKMEKKTNHQVIVLISLMISLCLLSTIVFLLFERFEMKQHWYLMWKHRQPSELLLETLKQFATFFLLYNTVVPVSLSLTLETVRLILARLIDQDVELYDGDSDTPALARASNLMEELGMVEYILTDKTGTLTKNDMVLKHMIIAADGHLNCLEPGSSLRRALSSGGNAAIELFLLMLSCCHTVIVEETDPKCENSQAVDDGQDNDLQQLPAYLASSPDELAIVKASAKLGHVFCKRIGPDTHVCVNGQERHFEILAIVEFTSERRRMSTVVKTDDGRFLVLCKGADSVILPLLCAEKNSAQYIGKSMAELDQFAREGLRTLCYAYRELTEQECSAWLVAWHAAMHAESDKQDAMDAAASSLERKLVLLGATGVEDKLQDGVQDTISCLLKANIRIWMLTGDKMETAVSTGFLSGLIRNDTIQLHLLDVDNLHGIKATLGAFHQRIMTASGEREFTLIVSGHIFSLLSDLQNDPKAKEVYNLFICVSSACLSVICCRLSPLQKAQVATLLKDRMKKITLAIGDGGNDVSMIQTANVGVGISGVEGLQAARAADFSIAQFRFLKKLVLVHGAWSVHRLSRVIQYFIFKNIVLYLGQFWFTFLNMSTGQTIYEDAMLVTYNMLFTQAPSAIIGITDQFVQATDLIENPQLYQFGQKERFNDNKSFWSSILSAILQSVLIYGSIYLLFRDGIIFGSGHADNLQVLSKIIYTVVLLTVTIKSALFTNYYTKLMLFGSAIGVAMWFAYIMAAERALQIAHLPSTANGIAWMLLTSPVFWATLLLVPVLVSARDYLWKFYRRQFRPYPYHIIQELKYAEKKPTKEIPKPIHTVFIGKSETATISRGFTFSQSAGQNVLLEAYGHSPKSLKQSLNLGE